MGTTWNDKSYNDTLTASNSLVRLATDLNDAMGSGGGATSPDDVLEALAVLREQVRLMEVQLLRERFPNATGYGQTNKQSSD